MVFRVFSAFFPPSKLTFAAIGDRIFDRELLFSGLVFYRSMCFQHSGRNRYENQTTHIRSCPSDNVSLLGDNPCLSGGKCRRQREHRERNRKICLGTRRYDCRNGCHGVRQRKGDIHRLFRFYRYRKRNRNRRGFGFWMGFHHKAACMDKRHAALGAGKARP